MNICHLIVVLKDPSDCSKRPVYTLYTRDPTSDHQYTETRSVKSTGGGAYDLSAAATPVSGRAVTKKKEEVHSVMLLRLLKFILVAVGMLHLFHC